MPATQSRDPDLRPAFAAVPPDRDGARLDAALAALLPGSSLRLRRRLIDQGRVLLDGRPAGPSRKVRAGQQIELVATPPACPAPEPRLILKTSRFAVLSKPAGLHSAALAGGSGPSLEALLPGLFPDLDARLVNRLDFLTSGLAVAAFGAGAEADWRAWEAAGRIRKEYRAAVAGRLERPLTLAAALDTADRARTRVLPQDDPDPLRRTEVLPLGPFGPGATLAAAVIARGARHQIRAHLATAGFPILGDPLYGAGGDFLHLHHFRLACPEFTAEDPAPWAVPFDADPDRA